MDDAERVRTTLDVSHGNGQLFAALAKAQEQAKTVGKTGENRGGPKTYNYATADGMIHAAREARRGTGLALVSAWSVEDLEPPSGNENQWPCAVVHITWSLVHTDGGYITGTASCHAIGSRGRPPDKAVAAALTYAEGFVERSVMRLDRGEDGADDVDRREEQETAPARRRTQRSERKSEPRDDTPRVGFGPDKGAALADLDDRSLARWVAMIEPRIDHEKYGHLAKRDLAAALDEQRKRAEKPDTVASGVESAVNGGKYPETVSGEAADDDIPF